MLVVLKFKMKHKKKTQYKIRKAAPLIKVLIRKAIVALAIYSKAQNLMKNQVCLLKNQVANPIPKAFI